MFKEMLKSISVSTDDCQYLKNEKIKNCIQKSGKKAATTSAILQQLETDIEFSSTLNFSFLNIVDFNITSSKIKI